MCNRPKNRETLQKGIQSRLAGPENVIEVVTEAEISEQRAARYIDNRMEAVGWGLSTGGALIYVTGLEQPIFLPDQYINWTTTSAQAEIRTLYASRESALAAIAGRQGQWFAFYMVVGGMTAPTVFSPASAPRIFAALQEAVRRLAEESAQLFTAMAVSLVGGALIRLGFRVLQYTKGWTPKGNWLGPKKSSSTAVDPAGTGTGGKPNATSRGIPGRGLPSDDVPPQTSGTQKRSGGSPPQTGGTQKRGVKSPPPAADPASASKRPLPRPGETPEEYYFRTTGESISDLPPAVRPAYIRQTTQQMKMAVIEAKLESPESIWSHYLTKGGYTSIMRSQRLRPGVGTTFGQGDGVRAHPGPFGNRAPITMGHTHFDFRVTDPSIKGVPTEFLGAPGAMWRTMQPLPIKIIRVGYTDGSFAQPLTGGKWRLTLPNGATRDLDGETLLQLGETPTQGLRK
jgi:hypothetical protein